MKQYNVTGMSCAACSARVEKAVGKVPGVTACSVSLLTNSMGVEGTAEPSAVIAAVEEAGYGASEKGAAQSSPSADEQQLEDHAKTAAGSARSPQHRRECRRPSAAERGFSRRFYRRNGPEARSYSFTPFFLRIEGDGHFPPGMTSFMWQQRSSRSRSVAALSRRRAPQSRHVSSTASRRISML